MSGLQSVVAPDARIKQARRLYALRDAFIGTTQKEAWQLREQGRGHSVGRASEFVR
jgi:hypothetical protein